MTDTEKELFRKVGRCIKSAAESWNMRMPGVNVGINYHVLDDIEGDLEAGLKAVKELFKLRDQ